MIAIFSAFLKIVFRYAKTLHVYTISIFRYLDRKNWLHYRRTEHGENIQIDELSVEWLASMRRPEERKKRKLLCFSRRCCWCCSGFLWRIIALARIKFSCTILLSYALYDKIANFITLFVAWDTLWKENIHTKRIYITKFYKF